MAGLYIHVPFCRKKCPYCNFYSVVSQRLRKNFIETLINEASHWALTWSSLEFETLYLGGGTPSLLTEDELRPLLDNLRKFFKFSAQAEFTLEVNPDDISKERLLLWKSLGVNRLSVGLQSLDEEALRFLERLHSPLEALEKLRLARRQGFSNISVDLIYGIPGLSRTAWLQTLEDVFEFRPQHISAYALTLEDNTIYGIRVNRNLVSAPPDSLAVAHFHLLRHKARSHGYRFYEVSNLCLPGYHSRHNSAYWKGTPYLGLGPSAHSFDGDKRWWNPASIGEWEKMVDKKSIPEAESLTPTMRFNEYLITRLRTQKGIHIPDFKQHFEHEAFVQFFEKVNNLPGGHLTITPEHIRIPVRNFLVSDGIIRRFIIED